MEKLTLSDSESLVNVLTLTFFSKAAQYDGQLENFQCFDN